MKIIIIVIILLLVASFFFIRKVIISKISPYEWTKYNLIAHAAGGIDGYAYTNSLDAFQRGIQNGQKLFEIDLSITKDGQLVCRHGWNDELGQGINKQVDYRTFMNNYYYDQFQPMDFQKVLDLMKSNPQIFVIIDGKVTSTKDVEELYAKINEVVNQIKDNVKLRLIPQMFYQDDLTVIRSCGFNDLLYVVGREEYTASSLAEYCEKNEIFAVSLSEARTNRELVDTLLDKGIKSYTYTINDQEKMQSLSNIGVHGFFTDYITSFESKPSS